ncbi:MAG: trypsin-like peptidase domain-containing protein [Planctomycetia bacterium]|nr:trypsin-like peptidase domain-containing protein [Planctomycetia bacterium]
MIALERRGRCKRFVSLLILVSGLVFLLLQCGVGQGKEDSTGARVLDTVAEPSAELVAQRQAQMISTAFRETSQKVIPSVVKIVIKGAEKEQSGKQSSLPFGDILPEFPGEEDIEGVGSGVIVSPEGVVLTNHHVVSEGNNILVELYDGRQVAVTSVKKDEKSDLAVLTLEQEGEYPSLVFADSERLEIGDWVLAIGNPFMLESSVSAGIVSAKKRLLQKNEHGIFIQTDAAVNPGNSGGPLVNLKGEIVGINTAIASLTGGYQGIGFAIPSNRAVWIMNQLIEKGRVDRAFLGAPVERLSYKESRAFGIPPRHGVKLGTPWQESPAALAGLRRNDIIVTFDEIPIDSLETLEMLVETADTAQEHHLGIIRNAEKPKVVAVQLQILPENYVGVPVVERLVDRGRHYNDRALGLMLIPLTDDSAKRQGYVGKEGLLVLNVMPGSLAWRAGVREGMLLTAVAGSPVVGTQEYEQLRGKTDLAAGLLLNLETPDGPKEFTVKKP